MLDVRNLYLTASCSREQRMVEFYMSFIVSRVMRGMAYDAESENRELSYVRLGILLFYRIAC